MKMNFFFFFSFYFLRLYQNLQIHLNVLHRIYEIDVYNFLSRHDVLDLICILNHSMKRIHNLFTLINWHILLIVLIFFPKLFLYQKLYIFMVDHYRNQNFYLCRRQGNLYFIFSFQQEFFIRLVEL